MQKLLLIFFIFKFACSFGQDIWITPNKGQWDERIEYSIDVNQGKLLLLPTGICYHLSNQMHHPHEEDIEGTEKPKAHAIFQNFIGANALGIRTERDSSSHYSNFFIGAEKSKWKSNIYSVKRVEKKDFYPGIDLYYLGENGQLSYNFKLDAYANVEQIKYSFEGADSVFLDASGALHILHSLGEIIHSKPIAWTINSNGKKTKVISAFEINSGEISFVFPKGYAKDEMLFIDPSLTFSTFSGSTTDNWGFTATPDLAGNLFGGGIAFGTGYPTTTGAYDPSFNSGTGSFPMDIGITKFNSNGTALLYSTYLGGNGNETPQSIVAAPNGDLYLYGTTSSSNFPMAGNSYDNSFNGGAYALENSLEFNGSDIYVAKLSANGTSLLASTYIGGSGIDGLNTNALHYNYGDQFRGEIILDPSGNVYIASTTASTNFPTVSGYSAILNGTQDAVIFKFNNLLSTLQWSTYFGGNGMESGNSIDFSAGALYIAGGTTSPNFPGVTSAMGNDNTFNGGLSDGYAIRLNPSNGTLMNATFMGLGEYDQTYFVRTDLNGSVYVYGQTESAWPITPGCYGNINSGQFIRKYDATLSTINWSTMFGAGSGHVEISPTAFLISDCFDIYIAGWGGVLNANPSVSQALNSTTNGFQCTPNGYQTITNGNNFYLSVFGQDAASLKYATFMGGQTGSSNHVDGGTSRFDKSGRIYHAVCGACGGNNFGFTSTPGSWSPQNPSPNCNLACFKFELSTITAIVAQPSPLICIPLPVIFNNTSQNGNTFAWNFGDGGSSNAFQPTHYYTNPGIYNVQLIVSDSIGCFTPDTANFTVNIGDFQGGVTLPPSEICPGQSYQLDAFGGSNYLWAPAGVLDNPNIPNPIATIYSNTTFTVVISDSCGSDTLQLDLLVFQNSLSISNDTSICIGNQVNLFAIGAGTISWSPGTYLDNNTSFTPISTPDTTIIYIATLTSPNGCVLTDTTQIFVFDNPPTSTLQDSLIMCQGGVLNIQVSGADSYNWYPNAYINPIFGPNVQVYPPSSQYYFCDLSNACGTVTDSIFIEVLSASVTAGNDTVICPGETANLWASGAVNYQWTPASSIINSTGNTVLVQPNSTTQYRVIGTDINNCKDTAYVQVVLHPQPSLQVTPSVQAFYGDLIQLNASANQAGSFVWSPPEFLSCINCSDPIANPDHDMTYYVFFTDINGCQVNQLVNISYDAVVYVPNTFIPDENGRNDTFHVYGGNISKLNLMIFDRWGELICELKTQDEFWDGKYKGKICQDGTYTWKLIYEDKQFKKYELTGHVNLIR